MMMAERDLPKALPSYLSDRTGSFCGLAHGARRHAPDYVEDLLAFAAAIETELDTAVAASGLYASAPSRLQARPELGN